MVETARFHDDRNAVLDGVDEAFAEPVRISFLADGASDPDRAAVEIDAILRVGRKDSADLGGGISRTWRTRLAAGKAELHINRASYDGPRPRGGDRVRALARAGQPWFEVANVDDRNLGRLILSMSEA